MSSRPEARGRLLSQGGLDAPPPPQPHTSKPKEKTSGTNQTLGVYSKQVYLWILPLVHKIPFLSEKMHKVCRFNIIAKSNNVNFVYSSCCTLS